MTLEPTTTCSTGYSVRLVRGITFAGRRLRAGLVLRIAPDRLSVAAHLVRTASAVPIDADTARDVELHGLLTAALPRQAG